jgi:DNA-binding IclR family transcriptional regulator
MITQPDLFELPEPKPTRPNMHGRSRKQLTILHYLRTHPEIPAISLTDALPMIGLNIYYNEKKHVQRILSNMVRRGLLFRPRHGRYALPPAQS